MSYPVVLMQMSDGHIEVRIIAQWDDACFEMLNRWAAFGGTWRVTTGIFWANIGGAR